MENIQVALRLRPLSRVETNRCDENIWVTGYDHKTVALSNHVYRDPSLAKKIGAGIRTTFTFDHSFNQEYDNAAVYERVVKRIALSSLNGINGTIFMYGQTGSGKTYTMMGYNKGDEDSDNTTSCSGSPMGKHSPRKSYVFTEKTQGDLEDQQQAGGDINQEAFIKNSFPSMRSYQAKDISQNTGILILALKDIFQAIENDLEKTYFLKCSYVEIYNDQIYDLLNTSDKLGETLAVNEDSKKEFFIKGVTEEFVSSIDEILEKLQRGEANRHYARTMMNHTSSRSHTIFRLMVQTLTNNFIREYRLEKSQVQSNINNSDLKTQVDESFSTPSEVQRSIVTESLLNFVDLAGSEKVSNHHMLLEEGGTGNLEYGGIYGRDSIMAAARIKERVKEGQHINKSLFFLTQVISLKSEGKSNQHIPYRNSPLTKILRSSLGGNSRTLVILCATPAASQFEQTVSTLRFGMNAKKIENRVQANIVTNDDTEVFRILITDYERKVRELEQARHEDHIRYANLLRHFDELQAQRASLIERMNNVLKFQLGRMAETISKDDIANFFKQVQQNFVHLDKVGILFTAKSLKKYDNASLKKQKSSPRRKNSRNSQGSWNRLSFDAASDEEIDTVNSLNTVEGVQQKARAMISQVSAIGLRSAKQQIALLQKKIDTLEDNFEELTHRNMKIYDIYLNVMGVYDVTKKKCLEDNKMMKQRLREKCSIAKNKIEDLVDRCTQQMSSLRELKAQVRLYRDMKGLDELSDEELSRLESHIWAKMDDVKIEKARRVLQKETGGKYVKKSLKKSASQEEEEEEEEFVVSLTEIETCESSYGEIEIDFIDDKKQEKLEQEAEAFVGIFRRGVTEIEEELEQIKRTSLEAEVSMLEKEKEAKELKETKRKSRKDKIKEEERKRGESSLSNKSREKEHRRHSSMKMEPRLDIAEMIAELKVEMDSLKTKGAYEAELLRLKNPNEIVSSRKMSNKIKQEKREDRRNSGGSFLAENNKDDELEKVAKETGSKEDLDFILRNDIPRSIKLEHDMNTSQEDAGITQSCKAVKEEKLVTVVSVKELLNSKSTKTTPSKPSLDKLSSNKKLMETVKKSMSKSYTRKDSNNTSRVLSAERGSPHKTEQDLSMSPTQRILKPEEELKLKKEISANVYTTKKSERELKTKSVEKSPIRRREEELLAQAKNQTTKYRVSSKSKERSVGSSPETKASKVKKLRLVIDETDNRSFAETLAVRDSKDKSQINIAQEFNSQRDIMNLQEKPQVQETKYLLPAQKMGVHRKNNHSMHTSNDYKEESKMIYYDTPYTEMGSIDAVGYINKDYTSYSTKAVRDVKPETYQYSFLQRENDPVEWKSAMWIGSRKSSITRMEGDLNVSDIVYPVDESKKRRSREERRKEKVLEAGVESISPISSSITKTNNYNNYNNNILRE